MSWIFFLLILYFIYKQLSKSVLKAKRQGKLNSPFLIPVRIPIGMMMPMTTVIRIRRKRSKRTATIEDTGKVRMKKKKTLMKS